MPDDARATPAPDDDAGWAALLLEHHEECTAEGHTGGDYPGKADDLREYDVLINGLYQARGQNVRVASANRAQALHLARTLVAQPEGTWRIELIDVDPDSPTCGDWITNPGITGPDPRDGHAAVNEAMLLAHQGGHITRAVFVTRKAAWTSGLLPWKRPGT
jgi:hypothetical protein